MHLSTSLQTEEEHRALEHPVMSAADKCLARIALREPDVHAWKHIAHEAVRREAAKCDSLPESQRSALHGLLVGVKDIFDTSDMPTGYGSLIYEANQPPADAAAVALLKNSGAIVVGKTVSTEFAGWPPPITRNPHDLSRTPGGSSSGSAAAVADGMIEAALGTQTLGSVIRPASFCGIVGLKPTYGRISRAGVKPLAESLDTVGVFARSVQTAERVYRALSGAPPAQFTDHAPVLAFSRGPNWRLVDEDAQGAIEQFVGRLRSAGLTIDEPDMPLLEPLPAAAKVIHDFEMWHGLTFERTQHSQQLSQSFQFGIDAAQRVTFHEYEGALHVAEEARIRVSQLVGKYDAMVTLSATGEAPSGYNSTGNPAMNSAWTLLHVPCVTIPVLQGCSGLPLGLQVIAPRFQDYKALNVAKWLHGFHLGAFD